MPQTAILLVNLGSPAAPTTSALRAYLAEFLSDPRVIDLPAWRWQPILHGIILRTRPAQSAKLYQAIWEETGAPLLRITTAQKEALQKALIDAGADVIVEEAMRYGAPAIADKITALQARGVTQILIIPMYPQYCESTTASVLDAVGQALLKTRHVPEWRFVHHWHSHPRYIQALLQSVRDYVAQAGMPDKLLLSYHGVPKRFIDEGDPYFAHCTATTEALSQALGWEAGRIEQVFQSRFGREEWIKPYADERLAALARAGVAHVAVLCPGFTADCLETIEEMGATNRALFLQAGGVRYDYIPALNDHPAHIALLLALITTHTQDWQALHPLRQHFATENKA